MQIEWDKVNDEYKDFTTALRLHKTLKSHLFARWSILKNGGSIFRVSRPLGSILCIVDWSYPEEDQSSKPETGLEVLLGSKLIMLKSNLIQLILGSKLLLTRLYTLCLNLTIHRKDLCPWNLPVPTLICHNNSCRPNQRATFWSPMNFLMASSDIIFQSLLLPPIIVRSRVYLLVCNSDASCLAWSYKC